MMVSLFLIKVLKILQLGLRPEVIQIACICVCYFMDTTVYKICQILLLLTLGSLIVI